MQFQAPPNAADFDRYRVTNANFSESIWQPLYDYNLYPAAGAQSLGFFQTPIASGITTALGATVGTPKTLSDTNMVLAGQLPSGMNFLATGVEVLFYPGSVSTANTYTPQTFTFFAAANAATVPAHLNDVNTFYQSGRLEFTVLAKTYLTITPLINFVPTAAFTLSGGVASTSATAGEAGALSARPTGMPFDLQPPISLAPAMNFDVTLRWPAVVALPSTFNARVGVQLPGYVYRAGQ